MRHWLDRHNWRPTSSAAPVGWAVLLLILAAFAATACQAQGCAQCLDATRATPPAVQAAYRHAIYLLAGTATALFCSAVLLLRRRG